MARLQKADLHGADLSYAKLNGATLVNADLRFVDLYGADLSGADLTDADLSNANLERTVRVGTIMPRDWQGDADAVSIGSEGDRGGSCRPRSREMDPTSIKGIHKALSPHEMRQSLLKDLPSTKVHSRKTCSKAKTRAALHETHPVVKEEGGPMGGPAVDRNADSSAISGATLSQVSQPPLSGPPAVEAKYYEGLEKERLLTYRERDPQARAAAIEYHGTKCMVCGFDFGEAYGEYGLGHIEVHHLRAVSTYLLEIRVDQDDMAVLCSNCHSMIHRDKDRGLSLEDLRKVLKRTWSGSTA